MVVWTPFFLKYRITLTRSITRRVGSGYITSRRPETIRLGIVLVTYCRMTRGDPDSDQTKVDDF